MPRKIYYISTEILPMKKLPFAFIICFMLLGNGAFSQTLIQAIDKNDTAMVLSLIKSGADVNALDENGATPLAKACRWNYISIVKLLLANGATVDAPRSKTGRTPLMVANAYLSGITITKLLVEHGANVNASADDGTTVLMLAAKYSKSDNVEYLLAHGADATAVDAKGRNALEYAQRATVAIDPAELPDSRIDKADCIARITKALGK